MHSANRTFLHAEPHVRLDWREVEALLGELSSAPGSHKPSPIIFMGTWIDHFYSMQARFRETHFFTAFDPLNRPGNATGPGLNQATVLQHDWFKLRGQSEMRKRTEASNRACYPKMAQAPNIPKASHISEKGRLHESPSSNLKLGSSPFLARLLFALVSRSLRRKGTPLV